MTEGTAHGNQGRSVNRRWFAVVLGAIVLVVAAFTGVMALRGPQVDALLVQSAPLVRTLQFSARVATLSRVDVGSTITGRVAEVRVAEGAQVRQGDVLVQLESDELAAALAQAVAALQTQFRVHYNEGLTLFTIKNYTPASVAQLTEGRTVLLVEDHLVNQKLATTLLERMGYAVDLAGDGRQGVDMAAQRRYDAILMDMQMPVMNGLDAARTIRQGAGINRDCWIIALTANAMESDRLECLGAGMNDFLSKPLRKDLLTAALARGPRAA